ncbi:response regulator [Candidatus Roizmanbacteria bacterium]|nr:response regulator [Candidatus Roizmanbacteria bacterium]
MLSSAVSKKILVVDDDEGISNAISLILELEGYVVETTLKGDETYHKIESFKPDVILLDVLISGTDGRRICHRLKQDRHTSQIPVIMISAHPTAEQSVRDCGAEAFLAKPFNSEELLGIVSKYAEG